MNLVRIADCETKAIQRYLKMQLASRWKYVGLWALILFFVLLFVNAFVIENDALREISKYGLLVSLLVISISREPIEDERITAIRMQSYAFAFLAGVLLALLQPLANALVDTVLDRPATSDLLENGTWITLWVLLSVQVLVYELMKRTSL